MQAVNDIEHYYQFSKIQIVDKLYNSLSSHAILIGTFQSQVQEQIEDVEAHIRLIRNQEPQWFKFTRHFNTFVQIFENYKTHLSIEAQSMKQNLKRTQDVLLSKIEESRISYHHVESQLLKLSREEVKNSNQKISTLQDRIANNIKDIESYKQEIFKRMLLFAQGLSEASIKKKSRLEYDLETYGKMSAEMKEQLTDNLGKFDDVIIRSYRQMVELQTQQQETLQKIIGAFNRADIERLKILCCVAGEMSGAFRIEFQPPNPYQFNIVKAEIPKPGTFANTHRMENAVHITMHPIPYKQLVLSHRSSLQKVLQNSFQEKTESKKPRTEFRCPENLSSNPYKHYSPFLEALDGYVSSFNKERISEQQEEAEIEIFKALRQKDFRELIIFYLYSAINQERQFNSEELVALLKVSNACLNQSFVLYDSHSVIRLLLVSLHVKIKGDIPFYKQLDISLFKVDFQFWEATFVENIYEYCQLIVNFYHEELQKSPNEPQRGSGVWNILKLTTWFKPKESQQKQIKSLKQLFPNILKNTFTMYLSLMRVFGVEESVYNKLVNYIKQAGAKMSFNEPTWNHVRSRLEKIKTASNAKLLILLRSPFLLQRILSKLLGPGGRNIEENSSVVSLSEEIQKWQKD